MAAKNDASAPSDESEVWNAISAFEQILEAMPNDRTSLETLAHAYEQIGDMTRAKEYVIRLANVIVSETDRVAAPELLAKLEPYTADEPEVQEIVTQLRSLVSEPETAAPAPKPDGTAAEPGDTPAAAPAAAAVPAQSSFNIANELPFAWNLLQANEITQDEYSNIVQDLTDMSGRDAALTVSVLHVLNDRGFKNLGRIMTTVSKDCGAPIIALGSFELQKEAFSLLPLNFMVSRGALIFDLFGNDALAVIMNPYDKQLTKEVESVCGRKCYFFMAQPAEFDQAIDRITTALEQVDE